MSKSETTNENIEALKVAQAEARVVAKHGDRIVPGSAQREASGKISVEIRTIGLDGEFDGLTRRVATSDVHQVYHQPEVKKELDKLKAKEKRPSKSGEVEALKAALREAGQDPDAVLAAAKAGEAEFDLG